MALMPSSQVVSGLPVSLAGSLNQLVIEKLLSGEAFDLAVRDSKTGFTFLNVEGGQYDYDANAKLLSITDGRLAGLQRIRGIPWPPVRRRLSRG